MRKNENTARGDYMTRGYFLVRDVLMKAKGAHMSADDVFGELRRRGEKIGRTTVYRQLDRLVGEGAVHRISGDHAGNCYSYADENCTEHYHMICTVCGRLSHLSCDHVEELYHHIKSEHGFEIDPSRTVLYGLCAACAREQRKNDAVQGEPAPTTLPERK